MPAFTIDLSNHSGLFILYTLGSNGLANSLVPGGLETDGILATVFRSDGFQEYEIGQIRPSCAISGIYCGRVIYFSADPDPSGPDQIDESFETAVVVEMFDPVDPLDPVDPTDPVEPPAPVPVPASVLLMASSLLLLSLARRFLGTSPAALSRRARARSAEC